jgi:hypothetical protein
MYEKQLNVVKAYLQTEKDGRKKQWMLGDSLAFGSSA